MSPSLSRTPTFHSTSPPDGSPLPDWHSSSGQPSFENTMADRPSSRPSAGPYSALLQEVGNNGIPPDIYPLKSCQGDCDNDDECFGNLVCYQRKRFEHVPGCSGQGDEGTDYCCHRPSNWLFFMDDDLGESAYGLCEGHCRSDSDCNGDLICFKRSDASDLVPGCDGEGYASKNYCAYPGGSALPTNSPTKALVLSRIVMKGGSPPVTSPLSLCEGECDDDDQCQDSLVCYRREESETLPGCSGAIEGKNYCVDRPPNYLLYVGDDLGTSKYGLCEGDCDNDGDCQGSLICSLRLDFDAVSGCEGSGRRNADYCRYPDPTTSPSTSLAPSGSPSSQIPSEAPTSLGPTISSRPSIEYYQYTQIGTQCEYLGELFQVAAPENYQGPAPFPDKSNVALQFFAFGDTPYDQSCDKCNSCVAEDGSKEANCTRFDCILKGITMDDLPANNTCTYEGPHFACLQKNLIPFMNSRIDIGDAAFIVHAGDMLKGGNVGTSKRCTNSAYKSRKELFNSSTNFLIVPGDNDWNECYGYDLYSNTDPVRELWRGHFADISSPFNQFSTDFPGGGRPYIHRKPGNPEMFFFEHNKIAFFGLNRVSPSRISYISDIAPVDLNAEWVEERLNMDHNTCSYESIVILAQALLKPVVYDKVDDYFEVCRPLPVLTITGDYHPDTFCLTKNSTNTRLDLTVEAFKSGPLLVSVVRDPTGGRGDYFHIDDSDSVDSNSKCPIFS